MCAIIVGYSVYMFIWIICFLTLSFVRTSKHRRALTHITQMRKFASPYVCMYVQLYLQL